MAAGAAAPELIVLTDLVIGLGALLLFITCLGMLWAWEHSFGVLLHELAGILTFDKWVVHIHWGGPVLALNNTIQHALSEGAQGSAVVVGRFFHAAAVMQAWVVTELRDLAHETGDLASWLVHVHIPKAAKWVLYGAALPLLVAKLVAQAITHLKPSVVKLTRTITHEGATVYRTRIAKPFEAEVNRIAGQVHALRVWAAAVGAGAIAGVGHIAIPWPRLGRLERAEHSLTKRVGRLEKLLGVGGLAALITATFGGEIVRMLRCGNVRKFGPQVCGVNANLLEGLFADAALVLGAISIVEFAKALQAVEGEAVKMLESIVTEL